MANVGPTFQGFATTLRQGGVGSTFQGTAASLRAFGVGPTFQGVATSFRGYGVGPTFQGNAVGGGVATFVRLLRLLEGRLKEIAETEVAKIAVIAKAGTGSGLLWTDDFVTEIRLGGGAPQELISIGSPGAIVTLNDSVLVEQSKIYKVAGDLRLGAVQATFPTRLGALGADILVNDAVDLTADAELLTSSLVGNVNEILTRPAVRTEIPLLNNTGGQLDLGTAVYPSASGEMDEASAALLNIASRLAGFLQADTVDAALGDVSNEGKVTVKFAAGEGAGAHNTKEVYLSITPGFSTLTAPAASGNVRLLVGYVADDANYNNGAGGTMEVQLAGGQASVVA